MNATKKHLTTLAAAAAMAIGGIAIAQTAAPAGDTAPAGAATGSSTTMDANTNSSTMGAPAGSTTTDTTTTPSAADTTMSPQADRN
ncbi:MAG: hypothetical protein EOO54_02415 [Haliea sp.]|nr:MAG: hypothetical protein EOO54_02415 [Haliea sp.]